MFLNVQKNLEMNLRNILKGQCDGSSNARSHLNFCIISRTLKKDSSMYVRICNKILKLFAAQGVCCKCLREHAKCEKVTELWYIKPFLHKDAQAATGRKRRAPRASMAAMRLQSTELECYRWSILLPLNICACKSSLQFILSVARLVASLVFGILADTAVILASR